MKHLPWLLLATVLAYPLVAQSISKERTCCLTDEQLEILGHMSLVYLDDGYGNLVNKTIRIEGVNVQVVNGLAATNGNPVDPYALAGVTNGVGNLIVGYNEAYTGDDPETSRLGSHNIIVGQGNTYSTFGGLVAARFNAVTGVYSTVSGGENNVASGPFSSVSGGGASDGDDGNEASGGYSSVSGGSGNLAAGGGASILGGFSNLAFGGDAAVGGGVYNAATGDEAWVGGGVSNRAGGDGGCVVSGGLENVAEGAGAATVSGGRRNTANAQSATVGGGSNRTASGGDDWVAGTLFEDN